MRLRPRVLAPALAVAVLMWWIGPFKPSLATLTGSVAGPAVVCASKSRPALAAATARDVGAARYSGHARRPAAQRVWYWFAQVRPPLAVASMPYSPVLMFMPITHPLAGLTNAAP